MPRGVGYKTGSGPKGKSTKTAGMVKATSTRGKSVGKTLKKSSKVRTYT